MGRDLDSRIATEVMRFAYADPPYPGMSGFYKEKTEVDHKELIHRLYDEFPDGWALSTASTTLAHVLSLCPKDVRIGAWVKPFCSFKPGVNPAYAWEPVIFRGGRKRGKKKNPEDYTRKDWTVRDWVSASITLKKGLTGAKPEAFNLWILDLLGYRVGDELVDLYPGTGGMGQCIAALTQKAVGG